VSRTLDALARGGPRRWRTDRSCHPSPLRGRADPIQHNGRVGRNLLDSVRSGSYNRRPTRKALIVNSPIAVRNGWFGAAVEGAMLRRVRTRRQLSSGQIQRERLAERSGFEPRLAESGPSRGNVYPPINATSLFAANWAWLADWKSQGHCSMRPDYAEYPVVD
jgi:hypothetical protein